MTILYKVAHKLSKFPKLKKCLKNIYQYVGYFISDKKTYPADISQISSDKSEHLFGYYDKCPWDSTGDHIIYLKVSGANKNAASSDEAQIIIKDLHLNKEKVIAKTKSWNVQQGCMLQWIGPDYNDNIIYNDFRNGKYCSVILSISSGKEKIIPLPIYYVSNDGTIALTLDFSRLNTFRPGYGYTNVKDKTALKKCPDLPCIWKIDLISGKITPLLTYRELLNFDTRSDMELAYHKVNHIMINPSGNRFMFLHRWILNGVKYDRLITSDLNGKDLYILLDDNMVSHCNWKDDKTIIAWAHTHKFKNHYYILTDKSNKKCILAKNELIVDGHPSYSPNGKFLITDSYPNFSRKQNLILCNLETQEVKNIASIYANIKYKNETRCDLHPRWKRDSTQICFDGAQKNYRQVYTLKINE